MSKKPIIGGIILVVIIGVIFVGAQINPDNPENQEDKKPLWSTRIVGSEQQEFYKYSSSGAAYEESTPITRTTFVTNPHTYAIPVLLKTCIECYEFDFVAMGDSPEQLRIQVVARSTSLFDDRIIPSTDSTYFYEILDLKGTLVDTGISEYYTWDYIGNKSFGIGVLRHDGYGGEYGHGSCITKTVPLFEPGVCRYHIIVERFGNLEGSVSIELIPMK